MTTPNQPVGAGLGGGGLCPAHIPRPPAPVPATNAVPGASADALPPEVSSERWPWRGVQWSLTYVGFLGYIFAITTYRFQIGDVSIVIALIGLLTMKDPIRVPGLLKGLGVFLLWGMIGWAVSDYPSLVYVRIDLMVRLWLIALVAANALRTRQQLRFFLVFWARGWAMRRSRSGICLRKNESPPRKACDACGTTTLSNPRFVAPSRWGSGCRRSRRRRRLELARVSALPCCRC